MDQTEKNIIQKYSDIDKKNYKFNLLSIIGNWKINNKDNYDYIILKEAFNWKRLAIKIIDFLSLDEKINSMVYHWLLTPHIYATFSEKKFKEIIGFEKYNSHLSYFYGVTIERCLVSFVEEEFYKKQLSYGNFLRYDQEDAYLKIYGISHKELFEEFILFYKKQSDSFTEVDYENFTYWCSKKRIENSEPSKLASDTKKGTMFLYKLLESENKRMGSIKDSNNTRKKNIDFVF